MQFLLKKERTMADEQQNGFKEYIDTVREMIMHENTLRNNRLTWMYFHN
jgi:hypothetical protein